MISDSAFAVVVGIDTYGAGLNAIDGPVNDAAQFTQILVKQGLSPERISVFVDKQPKPELAFPKGVIKGTPTSGRLLSCFLEELPEKHAKDLVLFWGGHGSIAREARRLFLSDSSTQNPFTFDLDSLVQYLESTRFGAEQFVRQIIVADVCANVLAAPYGVPEAKFSAHKERTGVEQFVLYAASPNQSAVNLKKQQTGLLSREFFNEVEKRSHEWPWKMNQIAEDLERRFIELRAEGYPHQSPTFLWVRDWQKNVSTIGKPIAAPEQQATGAQPPRLGLPQLMTLARALADVPSFRSQEDLDMIVTESMRPVIASRFVPYHDPLQNAKRLIRLCQSYPPALKELMTALEAVEEDSVQMKQALAVYQEVVHP